MITFAATVSSSPPWLRSARYTYMQSTQNEYRKICRGLQFTTAEVLAYANSDTKIPNDKHVISLKQVQTNVYVKLLSTV